MRKILLLNLFSMVFVFFFVDSKDLSAKTQIFSGFYNDIFEKDYINYDLLHCRLHSDLVYLRHRRS